MNYLKTAGVVVLGVVSITIGAYGLVGRSEAHNTSMGYYPPNEDFKRAVEAANEEVLPEKIFDFIWKKTFHYITFFESLDGLNNNVSGAGSNTITSNYLTMTTGAVLGNNNLVSKDPLLQGLKTFSQASRFRSSFEVTSVADQTIYITTSTSQGGTAVFYGFKIVNGNLYGVSSNNGTANESTVLLQAIAVSPDAYNIEARYTPSDKIIFLVNSVEKGVLTTGLPSPANTINTTLYEIKITTNAAAAKTIRLSFIEYFQRRNVLQ